MSFWRFRWVVSRGGGFGSIAPICRLRLARISHRLTGQAHERPAITSLRLLAVLNGL